MPKISAFFYMAALLLLPSCKTYLPFTTQLRNEFHLQPDDLRKVQFYVSSDFTLRRDVTSESTQLSPGGVLRFNNGRRIEEIKIKKYTPGIALQVQLSTDPPRSILQMSFMPNDNNNFIPFGVGEEQAADADAPYALIVPIWDADQSKIKYDNKIWNLDNSRHPYLVIRKAAFYKLKKVTKLLPGRVLE